MAAIHEANVVAYSIATEIVNDVIVNDDIFDENDEDSDTDTDGICIIVGQTVSSTQTEQKGDDSNDGSDETDNYIDSMTSRSEDMTIDDWEKDVFVDAQEETSQENFGSATSVLTMEADEDLEVDKSVRETLNRVIELLQSEEAVSTDQTSSISAISPADIICVQPDPNTNSDSITVATDETPENVIHTVSNDPTLTDLEDLDGEVEYFDSYAVFSPFGGGPNVVCATESNYVPDTSIDTASGIFSERSYQMSDTNTVNFSPHYYANVHTTHTQSYNVGYEYPVADVSPLTDNFPENHVQNFGDTLESQCPAPNGLENQVNIGADSLTIHVSQRIGGSDMKNPNEMHNYYESPYDGQDGDAEISCPPCDNPREVTTDWYTSPTSADEVDTSADIVSMEGNVDQTGVKKLEVSFTKSNSGSSNKQKPVDPVTNSNDILPLFHNSSLNPECEPFIPMQNYNNQYTVYSNGDSSSPTTGSHPVALSYDEKSHVPAYDPDPRNTTIFQGQTYMFPAHQYTSNGFFLEPRPQFGPGQSAYPVYPRNSTTQNPDFYQVQPSFQQTDSQFGISNQQQQYPITANGNQSTDFRYPAIYLSEAGLMTVLLRHDFTVEMTVDQVIRVVNHKKKLVALVNSEGTESYVFHPAARITQDLEIVEVEVFLQRKVKMTTEHITFANNFKCYKFDHEDIEEAEPEFADMRNDLSVDFLFSSDSCSDIDIIAQRAAKLAEEAKIEHGENGWCVVKINGVKIIQNERGEVTVNSGPKFIRMYPNNMSLQLKSNFLEVRIGINWSVKVSRGSHVLTASHCGFIVSNGRIEAGFDDANKPFACLLPRRVPILNDHRKFRRRHGAGTHIWRRSRTADDD
ncbi:uncharacterized protein LOC110460995 [Mizuhopecten yessoensis]|uniref:Uncharacterized protein n=1 Tax=Mizuhopecten yessoensis TaxID=6573 RepID=A0A210Q1D6_MIZYE|nr:uncharacterized protein LOC110460995 [Mizuhopecten yessoensis]OWF42479.1 hypothetical protein KP79_PYT19073 [Mizuhopecten yessoensis]